MSKRDRLNPTCPECGSTEVAQVRWPDGGACPGWRSCEKCGERFTLRTGRAETLRLWKEALGKP